MLEVEAGGTTGFSKLIIGLSEEVIIIWTFLEYSGFFDVVLDEDTEILSIIMVF
jgi:hypothetical protein